MLDILIIITVIVLLLAFFIWFFFKNVSKGIFKYLTESKSTDGAYEVKPDDPWFKTFEPIFHAYDWLETVEKEEIEIESLDGVSLHGIYLNQSCDKTFIYFSSYRSKAVKEAATISKVFYEAGYNVLIPDERATDESKGSYITLGLKESYDVVAWVKKAKELQPGKVVLYGNDMGGTAIIKAAKDIEYDWLILESPISPYKTISDSCGKKGAIQSIILAMVRGYFKRATKLDINNGEPDLYLPYLQGKVTYIVSLEDSSIPLEMQEKYYELICCEKEMIKANNSYHGLSLYCDKEVLSTIMKEID